MLEKLLLDNVWLAVLAWCIIYISDYALTIYSATLYRRGANEHIVLSGSYEITPYYQKDVDALRVVSSRFILALVLSSAFIAIEWLAMVQWTHLPQLFSFLIGVLFLLEFAVHVRHVRNIATFKLAVIPSAMQGTIAYSRPTSLNMSAVDIPSFGALYLMLWLFTGGWFLFGGVVACFVFAVRHWQYARKAARLAAQPAQATTSIT